MNSVVIDIETLDKTPSSVILSIGAFGFDTADLNKTRDDIIKNTTGDPADTFYSLSCFYTVVDIFDQLLEGRTVSEDTLDFWRNQKEDAQRVLYGDKLHLKFALQHLNDWLCTHNGSTIYFRGPDFDFSILDNAYQKFSGAILEHAYSSTGIICPWKFNKKRDVRTYIDAKLDTNLGFIKDFESCFIKIPHFALHDAMSDAEQMSASFTVNRSNKM